MEHYRYLIVGGGMTADAAVDGIREIDKDGSIGIVAAESDPPHSRPPLSKGLWKGDDPESVWRRTEDKQATVQTGRTVESIDVTRKRVTDDQQAVYGFDALLLATGGHRAGCPSVARRSSTTARWVITVDCARRPARDSGSP